MLAVDGRSHWWWEQRRGRAGEASVRGRVGDVAAGEDRLRAQRMAAATVTRAARSGTQGREKATLSSRPLLDMATSARSRLASGLRRSSRIAVSAPCVACASSQSRLQLIDDPEGERATRRESGRPAAGPCGRRARRTATSSHCRTTTTYARFDPALHPFDDVNRRARRQAGYMSATGKRRRCGRAEVQRVSRAHLAPERAAVGREEKTHPDVIVCSGEEHVVLRHRRQARLGERALRTDPIRGRHAAQSLPARARGRTVRLGRVQVLLDDLLRRERPGEGGAGRGVDVGEPVEVEVLRAVRRRGRDGRRVPLLGR